MCSCQPVDEYIFPEEAAPLLERERACAAHVEMQSDLPRYADPAVDLHAITRRGVIGLGRRQARGGGGRDEIILSLARRGMDGVCAREFDEAVKLGDAVLDRLEGADRLAEGLAG